MALGPIPPWLDINPRNALEAVRAGAGVGVQIAEMRNRAAEAQAALAARARESAERNALARWELDQNMAWKAQQLAAEREMAAAKLDETERFHQAGMEFNKLRERSIATGNLAAAAHYKAMERAAELRAAASASGGDNPRLVTYPELGEDVKVLVNKSGNIAKVIMPEKPMDPLRKMALEERLWRDMAPIGVESPTDLGYQGRTNAVGGMLRSLKLMDAADAHRTGGPPQYVPEPGGSVPPPPAAGTNAPGALGLRINAAEKLSGPALTKQQALEFMNRARGDRKLAEKLARDAGYTF